MSAGPPLPPALTVDETEGGSPKAKKSSRRASNALSAGSGESSLINSPYEQSTLSPHDQKRRKKSVTSSIVSAELPAMSEEERRRREQEHRMLAKPITNIGVGYDDILNAIHVRETERKSHLELFKEKVRKPPPSMKDRRKQEKAQRREEKAKLKAIRKAVEAEEAAKHADEENFIGSGRAKTEEEIEAEERRKLMAEERGGRVMGPKPPSERPVKYVPGAPYMHSSRLFATDPRRRTVSPTHSTSSGHHRHSLPAVNTARARPATHELPNTNPAATSAKTPRPPAQPPKVVVSEKIPYFPDIDKGIKYNHGKPNICPHRVLQWSTSPRIDTSSTKRPERRPPTPEDPRAYLEKKLQERIRQRKDRQEKQRLRREEAAQREEEEQRLRKERKEQERRERAEREAEAKRLAEEENERERIRLQEEERERKEHEAAEAKARREKRAKELADARRKEKEDREQRDEERRRKLEEEQAAAAKRRKDREEKEAQRAHEEKLRQERDGVVLDEARKRRELENESRSSMTAIRNEMTSENRKRKDDIKAAAMKERENKAALAIQSAERRRQAKKVAATKKVEKEKETEAKETEAATKIQAMQRGRQGRIAAEKKRAETIEKKKRQDDEDRRKREADMAEQRKKEEEAAKKAQQDAAKRLQAEKENKAATKIQSLQRQKKAKGIAQQKREDQKKKLDAEEDARRKAAIEEETKRREAAIKIQSLQRQKVAKKVAEQKRTEKLQKEAEDAAATKIQAVQRRRRATIHVEEMKTDLKRRNTAALKIQCSFRQRAARKELQKRREQRELIASEQRKRAAEDHAAAQAALEAKREERNQKLRQEKEQDIFTVEERAEMNDTEKVVEDYVKRATEKYLEIDKIRRESDSMDASTLSSEQVQEYNALKLQFMMEIVNQKRNAPLTMDAEEKARRGERLTKVVKPFIELLVRDTDANRSNMTLLTTVLRDLSEVDWARIIREDQLCHDAAVDGSVTYVDTFLGVPNLKLSKEECVELATVALNNQKYRLKFAEVLLRREFPLRMFETKDQLQPVWQNFFTNCSSKSTLHDNEEGLQQRMLILGNVAGHHNVDIDFSKEFDDGLTIVSRACAEDDEELLKMLISRASEKVEPALAHVSSVDGTTPLIQACLHNNVNIVQHLMHFDNVVKSVNHESNTNGNALEAAEFADADMEILMLLERSGALSPSPLRKNNASGVHNDSFGLPVEEQDTVSRPQTSEYKTREPSKSDDDDEDPLGKTSGSDWGDLEPMDDLSLGDASQTSLQT